MDRMYLISVVLLTVWSRLPCQTVGMINPTGATCDGTCRPGCHGDEVVSGTGNCGSLTGLVCCVECSAPWVLINGRCYLFSNAGGHDARNYTAARTFCKLYSNVDLATVRDDSCGYDEGPFMKYLHDTYPVTGTSNWFWLGATRTAPSTYEWVDGRGLAINSYLWNSNQPEDSASTECVAVLPRATSYSKRSYLFDQPCSYIGDFICEMQT